MQPTEPIIPSPLANSLIAARTALSPAFDRVTTNHGPDTYERMRMDPVVDLATETLRSLALNGPLEVVKPSQDEADQEAREIADFVERALATCRGGVDEALREMFEAAWLGCRVAEIVFRWGAEQDAQRLVLDRIRVLPQRAVGIQVDKFLEVTGLVALQDMQQPVYKPDRFWLLTHSPKEGDPRGTSVLAAAYNPWWTKQQLWPSRLRHLERFGSPTVIGTITGAATVGEGSGSPEEYLLGVLTQYVKGGSALALPSWAQAQLMEASSDQGSWSDAIGDVNREILYAVLGTARANLEAENGSRADSDNAQDVVDQLCAFYRQWMLGSFREQVVRRLVALNYGREVAERATPELSLPVAPMKDWPEALGAVSNAAAAGWVHLPSQKPALDTKLGLPPADMDALIAEREMAQDEALVAKRLKESMDQPRAGLSDEDQRS